MKNAVSKLLTVVNGKERDEFIKLSELTFIHMNKFKNLLPGKYFPILVLYYFSKPIIGINIEVESTQPLNIGKMHFLCTGNYHFGYLFEFPVHKIVRGKNFFGISRNEVKPEDYTYNLLATNTHLDVVGSENDAVLVMAKRKIWIDRAGWHGRNTRNDD